MKKIILVILGATLFLNVFPQSFNPEVISTSGEYFQNGKLTFSWTIGEPSIESYVNGAIVFNQGFQQGCINVNASPLSVQIEVNGVHENNVGLCGIGDYVTLYAAVSGGTAPYTYLWSGASGQISPTTSQTTTFTATSIGSYHIICHVTDNIGNNVTDTIFVVVNPIPDLSCSIDQTICKGNCTTLSCSTTTGNLLAWYLGTEGGTILGSTYCPPNSLTITVCPASTTNYWATAYDTTTGCSKSNEVKVTVSNVTATAQANPGLICIDGASNLSVSVAGNGTPPYTYNWSPTANLSGPHISNPIASPTATTTFCVTVTDVNGCTASSCVTVNVPLPPVVKDDTTICYGGCATLKCVAGGTPPLTYFWNPGGATTMTITPCPTVTTVYTVTVTDNNGCAASASAVVTVNPLPAVTTTDTTICSGQTAIISTSDVAGYSYYWSTGATINSAFVAPITTTTYTVTVVSGSGCSNSSMVTVMVNTAVADAGSPSTICPGSSATLDASGSTGSGPLSYNWSNPPGGTTSQITVNPTATTSYTLTVTSNGCTSSAIVTVTVSNSVILNVTPTNSVLCQNASVVLNATGAGNYTWAPSAGLSATSGASVTAYPTVTTIYTVNGSVGSCTGTTSVVVNVNPLPIPTITGAGSICAGNTATLDAGTGYSWYVWTTSANTQTISVTTAGTYTVTVSDASGCTGTASAVVSVNPSPVPTITGPASVCAGTTGNIYSTDAGMSNYVWTVSAGGIITAGGAMSDNSITVTWNTAGSQTVSVNYTDANGCTANIATVYNVTVNPLPDAQFSSTVNNLIVNVTPVITPGNKYFWDFGDGNVSNVPSTSNTYNTGGYYHVCLSVIDTITGCQNTHCEDILVSNPPAPCLAKFSYSLTGNTVTFTDSSIGNPNVWNWQFGDATISSSQNPVHTFTNNGIYTVSLSILNSTTNCMDNCQQIIQINNVNDCHADFSYYSDIVNYTASFSNLSVGSNITKYLWNFGDDSSSVLQNPVHQYQDAGNYNVCLTVYNPSTSCYDMVCKNVQIGDVNTCFADFIYTVNYTSRTAYFTDKSKGSPNKWKWIFGDGGNSNLQNPTHTYSANGIYKVHLDIKYPHTCNPKHLAKEVMININSTQQLLCNFGYNIDSTYHKKSNDYPVDFRAIAFGYPSKYIWDFGDGGKDSSTTTPTHDYNSTGTYNVCLTVIDQTIGQMNKFCANVNVADTVNNNVVNYSLNNSINIYPNPANDNIIIESSTFTKGQTISVYDVQGQLLLQQPMLKAKTIIDIAAFSKGLYFLKVENEKGIAVKMFVKG